MIRLVQKLKKLVESKLLNAFTFAAWKELEAFCGLGWCIFQ